MFRLKPDRRWGPAECLAVVAPLSEIAVDRRLVERAGGWLDVSVGCVDAMGFDQSNRFGGREMPVFLVRRPHLHRRDQFAVTFHLLCRQGPWRAAIGAAQCPWPGSLSERPV